LPGLPSDLLAGDGRVQVQLRFGREQGFAIANIQLHARAASDLSALHGAHAARGRYQLAGGGGGVGTRSEGAPAGWETFLAPKDD